MTRYITFVCFAVAMPSAFASIMSFTGGFAHDDNVQLIQVLVGAPSEVTFRSWSFAGGTNAAGQIVAAGGFEPVLSFFDADGTLLGLDSGGVFPNCGPRNVDPVSHFCLDAYMQQSLGPGIYTLAVTEANNLPIGALGQGFDHSGQGNFTGNEYLGVPRAFVLFDGSQRTNLWAVDVSGINSAAEVPEPSTMLVLILSIAAACIVGRYRRQHKLEQSTGL